MKKLSILAPVVCALLLASCTFTPNNLIPSKDGSDSTSQADSSQGGGSQADSSQGGGSQGGSSQGGTSQGNMNRAQANLLLSEAVAHVSSKSFALPNKYRAQQKTEIFSEDEAGQIVGSISNEAIVDYNGDAKTCSVATIVNLGPSLSGESYSWIWSDSEQGYYAQSASLTDFSDASYSEIPLEDYEDAFASLSSDYALDKEDIASNLATVIGVFSSIEQMLSDDGTVTTEDTTVTYDLSKKELAETYNSTCAGNLSASISLAIAGTITAVYTEEGETRESVQTVDGEIELNFLMNDYLPVTLDLQEDVDMIVDGEEQNMNVHMEAQYKWGVSNFSAPDLSLFPEPGLPTGELDREEALAVLMDAMTHAFDDSFEIPDEYTYQIKDETYIKDQDGEISQVISSETGVSYNADEMTCRAMSILSQEEGAQLFSMDWIWADKTSGYIAHSPSYDDYSEATYSEIALDDYEDAFASFASDYALDVYDVVSPMSMAFGLLSSADMYLSEETMDLGSVSMTYDLSEKDLIEYYYSSEEGSLAANLLLEMEGTVTVSTEGEEVVIPLEGEIQLRIVIEDYLPVRIDAYKDLTTIEDGERSNESFTKEYSYEWGYSSFSAPDLSQFPKQGNEGGEGQVGADGEI